MLFLQNMSLIIMDEFEQISGGGHAYSVLLRHYLTETNMKMAPEFVSLRHSPPTPSFPYTLLPTLFSPYTLLSLHSPTYTYPTLLPLD